MMDESRELASSERELKQSLQSAVAKPFDEVDWESLHGRIIADGERHFRDARGRTSDWVAAWSPRGIPVAAGALAAAIAGLWILPILGPVGSAPPPGFWPVAEELVSSLPEGTRDLLSAGSDLESMLTAVVAYSERER